MSTDTKKTDDAQADEQKAESFAEVALRLGGASEDEARRTGVLDSADDQVEDLFAPQYQTVNSPAHRAVWDKEVPTELFQCADAKDDPEVEKVVEDSIALVRRHRDAGTLYDENSKVREDVLTELGTVGYWGMLVDKKYGGAGSSMRQFSRMITRMSTIDPTIAGLSSVHGCIGAVDPVRGFGNSEQKERILPKLADGTRLSAFALTEPCAGSDLTALRTTAHLDGDDRAAPGSRDRAPLGDGGALVPARGAAGEPGRLALEHRRRLGPDRGDRRLDRGGLRLGGALPGLLAGIFGLVVALPGARPGRIDPGWRRQLEQHEVPGHADRQELERRRVIAAGAPLPGPTLARWHAMLSNDADVYPPYGATESLPVACIAGREIVRQTWPQTEAGAGVCVGTPVPDIEVKIIRISDHAIGEMRGDLEVADGEVGEIAVRGPMVTEAYFGDSKATEASKIRDGGTIWHRMGDLGWRDTHGRIWFCGRKGHRVELEDRTLFTIPCEKIFDTHPEVYRTALVAPRFGGRPEPTLCVELEAGCSKRQWPRIERELREMARSHEMLQPIASFVVHEGFPVDIRHNAKIGREKLTAWLESKGRR